MIESWRWFGQFDNIPLAHIAQTGATGIVTALHEVPYGTVWPREAIATRKAEIEAAGLSWVMVESLPVDERIKRGEAGIDKLFANYRQSMANLAAEGIHTICYNFMPVLDWTRTDLRHPLPHGGRCLRFDAVKMAAFEYHMLGREAAIDAYPTAVLDDARSWIEASTEADQQELLVSIMSGLPGAFDRYDIDGLRAQLVKYDGIGRAEIRENLKRFLEEVTPAAEDLGVRLCIHPDDPPRDILGLPRIVSSEADIAWILDAVDTQANGLTLCTGSLGAGPTNDLPLIAARFASRTYFAHLRNVAKDANGSFQEADHLGGDTDMVAVIRALIAEEKRRSEAGEKNAKIVMRADHGHELINDDQIGNQPGYPLIGRLKGLAELRGVALAVADELAR